MLRGALLLLAAIAALPAFPAERTPTPAIERARAGPCVAPPGEMRRNHMEMLRHARDQTVRAGVRPVKASLNGCIECHASRTTGSVAAGPRDFCVSCHSYAAVRIDCFDCHASRPKATAARAER